MRVLSAKTVIHTSEEDLEVVLSGLKCGVWHGAHALVKRNLGDASHSVILSDLDCGLLETTRMVVPPDYWLSCCVLVPPERMEPCNTSMQVCSASMAEVLTYVLQRP